MATRTRRGLVLGCGGTLGAAWTTGALTALEEATGWDARMADVIVGTSAGAEFATMLGAGVGVADILAAHQRLPGADPRLTAHLRDAPAAFPPRPRARLGSPKLLRASVPRLTALSGLLPIGRGDAGWLASLADDLAPHGWVPHPATWLVGVDYATGQRVAFGSPGAPEAPLRDAIRASWAIPGWFPPVEIDGRRYVDGGVASPASADLVASAGLREVVVIAPMASIDPGPARGLARPERLLRKVMTATVAAEVAALRAAGIRVLLLTPGRADLSAIGPNPMDGRRAGTVLETSLRTSRAAMDQLGHELAA